MSEKPTTYRFDDWQVEPLANTVRRRQTEKQLEPLTMNVLSHLLEHAGEVVSADELLDRFWAGRHAEPSMVARCITQIRSALGDDARHPVYVETIRKRGYRTVASVRQFRGGIGLADVAVAVQDHAPANAGGEPDNRIAVLPFENLSPDPRDAYFAAGIHDEILSRLSKVNAISVVARNSVVPFADGPHVIADIADELGVTSLMTGSLRYAGGRVRISVRLVDGATETLKWAETYERELADIFSIQADIAIQVAKAMEVQFTHAEREGLTSVPTTNMDAYTHYIRGVFLLRSWEFVPAIRELERAITADPEFALALAHKAYIHSIAGTSGFGARDVMSAKEAMHSMSVAASLVQRALEIDPSQALAYTAQGKVEMFNRNWDQVTRHSASGYALNPDQVDVAFAHAWSQLDEGRQDRAFSVHDRMMVLDPLNTPVPLHASIRVRMSGRQDVAIRLCKRYLHSQPGDPAGYLLCALSAAMIDDTTLARAMLDRAEKFRSEFDLTHLVLLLEVQQRLGNRRRVSKLEEIVSKAALEQQFERDVPILFHLAQRNATAAVRALQQAAEDQIPSDTIRDLHHYPENPLFDPIRHHPQFQSLLTLIAEPALRQATPTRGSLA